MESDKIMSSFVAERRRNHLLSVDTSTAPWVQMDRLLDEIASIACTNHQVRYESLSMIQRLFITHYRCEMCGLMPLYYLDLTHTKRVRCDKCRTLVSFKKTGKYGGLRKEIASIIQEKRISLRWRGGS